MADLSTQLPSGMARRVTASLLRAGGGTAACLQMPPTPGDSSNAAQLGLNAPGFLSLPLAPVVFRKSRVPMQEGQPPKYELLVSADAVEAQVAQLSLACGEALFSMAAGVVIAGQLFLIEAVSASESQGEAYLYRLLLRESAGPQQL